MLEDYFSDVFIKQLYVSKAVFKLIFSNKFFPKFFLHERKKYVKYMVAKNVLILNEWTFIIMKGHSINSFPSHIDVIKLLIKNQ